MIPITDMRVQRLTFAFLLLWSCVAMVTRGHGGHEHAPIPESERPTNFNDARFTQDEE